MRIVVTGSDGYIGYGVVERLVTAGHEVLALGLAPCGIKSPFLEEIVGDAFTYRFDNSHVPDVLLHLAWRNGFSHSDPCHVDDLPRHYHFLESALEAGVPRIAVMGTMHEVGYHEGSVKDTTPCNPTTPYGVAKNALRQLTEGMCHSNGVKLQWLRGFYLSSSDGRGSSIFAKIVQASREGKSDFPFTSGRNAYDFLDYGEFCDQVVSAITQDDICGVINICSGMPVSLGNYIEKFIKDNNLSINLQYGQFPDRSYDSPAIWGDAEKIREIVRRKAGC